MNGIKDLSNDLDVNHVIDSFEQNWYQWNINDTIEWFKFALTNDYQIEDYGTSSDSSDDENHDKNQDDIGTKQLQSQVIDFQQVETNLVSINFNAKKYFPVLLKSFQFKQFGFKNTKDCKYLCQKVKLLMQKYPKNKKKTNKKNDNNNLKARKNDNHINQCQLEGFVPDTNVS